jgi:hypothetical protein
MTASTRRHGPGALVVTGGGRGIGADIAAPIPEAPLPRGRYICGTGYVS